MSNYVSRVASTGSPSRLLKAFSAYSPYPLTQNPRSIAPKPGRSQTCPFSDPKFCQGRLKTGKVTCNAAKAELDRGQTFHMYLTFFGQVLN